MQSCICNPVYKNAQHSVWHALSAYHVSCHFFHDDGYMMLFLENPQQLPVMAKLLSQAFQVSLSP